MEDNKENYWFDIGSNSGNLYKFINKWRWLKMSKQNMDMVLSYGTFSTDNWHFQQNNYNRLPR